MMRAVQITALFIALSFAAAASAQAVQEGQVLAMNEQNGAVTIKLNDGTTKQYRLRDGLVFSAVQAGDVIRFTTDQENGQPVLSKIEKR
jgi:Cu/Ag efflux protein CusF